MQYASQRWVGVDRLCRNHADRSVAQFADGQKRNCGITPPVWSPGRNAHFGWCMAQGANATTPELARCDAFLALSWKLNRG
ncbi:MAG: hypothetical protein GY717_16065 [Rhodobacteraceae bacterium]|nr:hypothetical protein [Paracoccaceae bacterium]